MPHYSRSRRRRDDVDPVNTVYFNGKALNMPQLAHDTGLSGGFLSKVFSSYSRRPSMFAARDLAKSLGMSMEDFVSVWEQELADLKVWLEKRKHIKLPARRRE